MFRRNTKQYAFLFLLWMLILITLSNENIASEKSWGESWDSTLAPLTRLNPVEKKVVVVSVRGRVNINYEKTVEHNLKGKKDEDKLWGMKVFARSNVMMSRLSEYAQWKLMEAYYNYETDYVVQLIQGKIDWNLYHGNAKSNQARLKRALDEIKLSQSELMRIHDKNIILIDRISTFIIGDAKTHALK